MEWFRHDTDALSDPAVQRLIDAHGATGYGLFWAIVEHLARSADGMLTTEELAPLSRLCNVDREMFDKVFDTLLVVELIVPRTTGGRDAWTNERLVEEISNRRESIEKRRRAGRRGGQASAVSRSKQSSTNASSGDEANVERAGSTYLPTYLPTDIQTESEDARTRAVALVLKEIDTKEIVEFAKGRAPDVILTSFAKHFAEYVVDEKKKYKSNPGRFKTWLRTEQSRIASGAKSRFKRRSMGR